MKVALTICLLLLCAAVAGSGLAEEVGYRHTVGGGVNMGTGLGNDSKLWGCTLDYARLLDSGWTFGISAAFDEGTERLKGEKDEVVKTYSSNLVWTYPVANRLSLGAGFGKDLVNDDTRGGDYETVGWNSGWTTGVTGVYELLSQDRHSLSVATTLEYNFSDSNSQITFDLSYAWSF